MPKWSDDARLVLFRDVARRIERSSALPRLRRSAVEIAEPVKGEIRVTMNQPDDEAMRAFVVDLREFANPRHDLYLPGIITILGDRVSSGQRELLQELGPVFDQLYKPSRWTVRMSRQPDAYNLSSWEAFDLWAYAHHIHLDVEKVDRFGRMHPIAQAFVRMAAFDFMANLVLLIGAVAGQVEDEASGQPD
jgi:hypothetical protein